MAKKKGVTKYEKLDSSFKPAKVRKVLNFGKYQETRVQVAINEFSDGNNYVDIRQFYTTDDETYKPTNKGLSIHMKHLLKLQKAVNKSVRMARKLDLLDE